MKRTIGKIYAFTQSAKKGEISYELAIKAIAASIESLLKGSG